MSGWKEKTDRKCPNCDRKLTWAELIAGDLASAWDTCKHAGCCVACIRKLLGKVK